jgi:hypothetical protein
MFSFCQSWSWQVPVYLLNSVSKSLSQWVVSILRWGSREDSRVDGSERGCSAAHCLKKCLDKYKPRRKSVAYWIKHLSLQDNSAFSIAWRDFPTNFPSPCWNQTIRREWMISNLMWRWLSKNLSWNKPFATSARNCRRDRQVGGTTVNIGETVNCPNDP